MNRTTVLGFVLVVFASSSQTLVAQSQPPSVGVWTAIPSDSDAPRGAAPVELAVPAAVDGGRSADPAANSNEFVIAPLPVINPTLDYGVALVVGYLYRLDPSDRVTAPSLTMGGGFKTSNGSWGVAAAQQLHLHGDRYRLLAAAAYAEVNYEFFGIGQDAGSSGRSIPLAQDGSVGLAEGLVLLGGQWYAGARYQYMNMRVRIDQTALPDSAPALPEGDLNLRTAALGPRLQRDTRDNPFYPRRGAVVNVIAAFYEESLGGRRSYQSYQAWISDYLSIGSKQVVAWRIAGCATAGNVPFYDLCQVGKSQDVRGYTIGQYRDSVLVAAQMEYRAELWKRFGGTLFLGAAEAAPSFDRLTWQDALPGGGVGLRYTLATRNHVNLRVDYAWGRASHAFYVSVAEAF